MPSDPTTPMARLAVVITIGFFVVMFGMPFAPVGDDVKEPLLMMVGALISCFTSVVSYYFGTSRSSAKKDDTITELTRTASVVATSAAAASAPATPADAPAAAKNTTVDKKDSS